MIRQLAIPVKRRIAAPIKIANVEVSPIEPGIRPKKESKVEIFSPKIFTNVRSPLAAVYVATCPNGVAPEKPSTT